MAISPATPPADAVVDIPYQNDPAVREVFADTIRLTTFDGQMMHFEFTVLRPEAVGVNQIKSTAITAARLVLPLAAAASLRDQLNQIVANLEKNGTLRRVAPETGTRQ